MILTGRDERNTSLRRRNDADADQRRTPAPREIPRPSGQRERPAYPFQPRPGTTVAEWNPTEPLEDL